MLNYRVIGLLAWCLAGASSAPVQGAELTGKVKVSGGEVAGLQADGLKTFFGIPFAAPPVGELRWRAPQAVLPWKGVKEVRAFASACAQTAVWHKEPKSEDCLFVNVWAPAKAKKLPVIVWIHGGGFYGGSGSYDAGNLARRGAVIVSMNYRLGVLGFFAHPELSAEAPGRAAGNQAILDQVAALRWVKDNIAAFGGDPGRVTIMGESSGSESVAILVSSPAAKGLFHRAIAQSGNDAMALHPDEASRFDSRPQAEAKGAEYAKAVGAPGLAALRALSVEALHKQAWSPRTVVDGHVLRDDMTSAYRNGRHNDVPILIGWNAEEGKDLTREIPHFEHLTGEHIRGMVGMKLARAPSEALLAKYPGIVEAKPQRAAVDQMMTDWWGWRMARWGQLQARYGRAKPYVYFFAHQPAEPLTPCEYSCGAGHGAEIPYVFHNLDARPWKPADRQLATRLAATWVNFAATGTPNGKGLPAWPAFDGADTTVHLIGTEADLKNFPLRDLSHFPALAE